MNLYFAHQRMAKKFVNDFKNTGFEVHFLQETCFAMQGWTIGLVYQ